MSNSNTSVSAGTLRRWLENNEPVFILDVRPVAQRQEWYIPGSHYLDAYKRLNEGDNTVLDEITIPKDARVVTVCAAGRTSQIASEALRGKGIDAWSLEGGMKAWGTAWNIAERKFDGFEIFQVRRTGKGCLSYIVSSKSEAIIIDASLPVEVYKELILKHHLSVKYVAETHIHADHLSRSKEVAASFQVPLFLPVPNKVQFSFNPITAETTFSIGSTTIRSLPTPGHTLDSYCLYLEDLVLFTGDTLFTNGVGRPDLNANIEEGRNKAGLLYESLKKILSLKEEVLLLPAHTNTPIDFNNKMIDTTIRQAKESIALLRSSKEVFIDSLLQKIPPTPANYLTIVEKNLSGDYADVNPVELEAGANRCAIS